MTIFYKLIDKLGGDIMINKNMKSLIMDMNVLIYIYDIISIRENNEDFIYSNTYKELHENDFITMVKYLKRTRFIVLSFIAVIYFLKKIIFQSSIIQYGVISIISIIFGILFIKCNQEFKLLHYQLKAKKAVQYALVHYNYREFVFFIDNYLSEESTKNHFLKKNYPL